MGLKRASATGSPKERPFLLAMLRRLLFLLLPLVLPVLPAGAQEAPPGAVRLRPQKSAKELIVRQDPPKVVPRVLDRATPDNTSLVVSLSRQRAFLFVEDEVAIDTPVSTGKRRGMTVPGVYSVLQKQAEHRSALHGEFVDREGRTVRAGVSTRIDPAPSGTTFRNTPMPYFLRLTEDGFGLHAGHLPGYPASHGCVRLPADIAPLVFQRVRVGTVVKIED